MSDQISFTPQRAVSSAFAASPGAKVRFYQTGTTTPITVYTDAAATVPIAQPVIADAAGVFPQVFSVASTAVKAVVTASDDTAIFTLDPCALTATESGQASQVSVVPFTGVAATNVQDALQALQSNIGGETANAQTIVETGGSGGGYTLTAASAITDYAQGQRFVIRPNHANTGAATIDIDGLGPKSISRYDGNTIADLRQDDLRVGFIAEISYDGTRFILINSMAEGVPVGSILFHGSNTAPPGYLKANGALYSRTTYPELFIKIGTVWGGGDGSTTFAVPDLRGEFLRGWDDARGVDSGRVFGSAQSGMVGPHTHQLSTIRTADGGDLVTDRHVPENTGTIIGSQNWLINANTGTETRPRNIAALFCIKY